MKTTLNKNVPQIIVIIVLVIIIIGLTILSGNGERFNVIELSPTYLLIFDFALILYIVSFRLLRFRKSTKETKAEMESLIEQREQINSEIADLAKKLYNLSPTDYHEYLEIAQLASFRQQSFLQEHGFQGENHVGPVANALLLTSPDKEGEEQYESCQKILSGSNIPLEKKDTSAPQDGDSVKTVVDSLRGANPILLDVNQGNPLSYYVLGIAQAIGKPVILLSKSAAPPFATAVEQLITYTDQADLEKQLKEQFSSLKAPEKAAL